MPCELTVITPLFGWLVICQLLGINVPSRSAEAGAARDRYR